MGWSILCKYNDWAGYTCTVTEATELGGVEEVPPTRAYGAREKEVVIGHPNRALGCEIIRKAGYEWLHGSSYTKDYIFIKTKLR